MIEGNFYKILEIELSCVEYLKRKRPATIVLLLLVLGIGILEMDSLS